MSDTKSFDLIVIGGGTGGNGVARMTANAGWRVASFDSLPFGGTCALRGCDPKKMLIAVTEGVEWARSLDGKGLEARSEERRVGNEGVSTGRSRWSPNHYKKKQQIHTTISFYLETIPMIK